MVYSGKKALEGGEVPVEPRIGVFICHCGTNIAGSLESPKTTRTCVLPPVRT